MNKKIYYCCFCMREFESLKAIIEHMKTFHKFIIEAEKDG